jgi:hypothetical protein
MLSCLLVLGACSQAGQAQDAPEAMAAEKATVEVPVTRVVLFSSGVGYFEHDGRVSGDATAKLDFKTAQINDILKSMVLMDLDGGAISTVNYASQDPIARALKSFGVDLSGNPTLGQLLGQLRGVQVEIAGTPTITGKIISVETQVQVVGQPPAKIERELLNLLTERGMMAISLNEIRGIRLLDERLQGELNQALNLLADSRDTEKKAVEIHFAGEGERKIVIGYVVESPVWKTSYRLLLPDKGGKAQMQGWAIVENTSDSDWKNVRLSLVSGRPVSFIQDLYQPLYIPRPVVQPDLYASLQPQMDTGGMAVEKAAQDSVAARSGSIEGGL